jgi:hypothetical protein
VGKIAHSHFSRYMHMKRGKKDGNFKKATSGLEVWL